MPRTPAAPSTPSLPDACHGGVALRAFVAANALALALSLYPAAAPWPRGLLQAAALTEPAVTLWLTIMCLGARLWRRRPPALQLWLGIAAGALAPWAVRSLLQPVLDPAGMDAGWRAAPLGALLAALFLHDMGLRARALDPATVQARLDALQARIRPHFLFNALNAAAALVHDQPQRAEQVLDDLAALFRAAVEHGGSRRSLGDEIDLARRYLDIERVRFDSRIQLHWDLDPSLDGLEVPMLTLQPLLENAVRHGVEPSPDPCRIDVRTTSRAGMLEIEVVNDFTPGVPRAGAPGAGVALSNIEQRLRLIYDIDAELTHGALPQRQPARYRVRLRIPK